MFEQSIDMASGGFGHGMPHQDYDPPQAHNPGITFRESTGLDQGYVLNRTIQLQA